MIQTISVQKIILFRDMNDLLKPFYTTVRIDEMILSKVILIILRERLS